ncbi:MAG: hypothetical protein HY562_01995 [Ignavibacteriales bacterium]|nr:hypothetical protein [Ignavibacteriales bacterium]
MNTKKIVYSAIVGGVVFFIWGGISHSLLPFYNNTFHAFTNEDEVAHVISANAPASGIYFMPWMPMGESQPDSATAAKLMDRLMNGPFLFAAIRVNPLGSYPMLFAVEIVNDILIALLVTLLIISLKTSSFRDRILAAEGVALIVFFTRVVRDWNWYSFSTSYTLVTGLDMLVGFSLLAFVVSRFFRPQQQMT